jgi:enoyl-CoA hydratase/carnithine racemase
MDEWTAGAVLRRIDEGILVVTLNRPDRGNAWSWDLEERYLDTLEAAADVPEVGAIVVTGAGRSFCVGADATAVDAESKVGPRRMMSIPLAVPKPIVAAINGGCAGIGLVQALLCDVRFATPQAKLTTAFARRGLVAEHGISWVLPRLVGPARALDLLLSGRVFTGADAAAMGLVHAVAEDPLAEALAYARELLTWSSPTSMAVIKKQVYADLDVSLDDALEAADRLTAESLDRVDVTEGFASFLEKREPRFPPLDSLSVSASHRPPSWPGEKPPAP